MVSATYPKAYFDHIRDHAPVVRADLRSFDRHSGAEARILDVGCGRGEFLEACAGRFGLSIGLDSARAAVEMCTQKGLAVVQADIVAMPFLDASFDGIRVKEVLEHLYYPNLALSEVRRVLRPGGLVIIHVPTHYSILYPIGNFYDDYTHIRPLSRVGVLRMLVDNEFKCLRISGYTSGRSVLERAVGAVIQRLVPHIWRAEATKD